MFINVAYKDAPELSTVRRSSSEIDLSVEKLLLVNPNCPVRIMLEYIRKKCRLGVFTQFDLCDENGILKGLFSMPTYVYATDQFEHKKTYYVIVIKQDIDKRLSVLPQINHENKIYLDLKTKLQKYLAVGDITPVPSPPLGLNPPTISPPINKSPDIDKRLSVLPQINHENKIYLDLKTKLQKYLAVGDITPVPSPPLGLNPPTISPPINKSPVMKQIGKKK